MMSEQNRVWLEKARAANLTKEDRAYIRAHMDTLTPEQLALDLSKSLKVIRRFIERTKALSVIGKDGRRRQINKYLAQLKSTPEYDKLKDELTDNELEYFEHSYTELVKQFKGDVLATEKIQICLVVKLDILMARNMKERKRATIDIERTEAEISKIIKIKEVEGELDDGDRSLLEAMENQLASAKSAQKVQTSEYTRLMETHRQLLRELKATRDQRIERIENSAESFLNYIKALQNEEQNDAAGRYAELMRLASEQEARRLAKPHTYADGRVDQPLLNSNTVKGDVTTYE